MSEVESTTEENKILKNLIFRVGDQFYGAPLADITEVVEPCHVTPSPNSPKEFLGLINLRGEIISVIDFRAILGQPQNQHNKMLQIIVPTRNGKTAVLVDELIEVHDFTPADVDFNPNIKTSISKESLTGVGKFQNKVVYLIVLAELLGGRVNNQEAV